MSEFNEAVAGVVDEIERLTEENARLHAQVKALRRSLEDALAKKYLSRARRVLIQTEPRKETP